MSNTSKTVCRFYLQGKCVYGSECRFLHQNKPKAAAEEVSPYTILKERWDSLLWKGTSIWTKNSEQPAFEGLGLTMEEIRWIFYQQPSSNWRQLQVQFLKSIEEKRINWLQDYEMKNTKTSSLFSSNNTSSLFGNTNIENPPLFSNINNSNTVSIFGSSNQTANPPVSNSLFSTPNNSIFGNQSLFSSTQQTPTISSFNTAPQQLNLFGQSNNTFDCSNNTTLLSSEPNAFSSSQQHPFYNKFNNTSNTNNVINPQPAIDTSADINTQAAQIKQAYNLNHEVWEVAAYLCPEFPNYKVPLNPPPFNINNIKL